MCTQISKDHREDDARDLAGHHEHSAPPQLSSMAPLHELLSAKGLNSNHNPTPVTCQCLLLPQQEVSGLQF